MVDIFKDNTKVMPKGDNMIVRVPMDELEIAGRKSHLPNQEKSDMTIKHVTNTGSKD